MGAFQPSSIRRWQVAYEAALLEFNPAKLLKRIAKAEKAIADEAVTLMCEGRYSVERYALEHAMQVLETLKENEAGGCV